MDLTYTLENNFDAIVVLLEKVNKYMDRHGFPEMIKYNIGLCLEEVVTNIVKFSFDDPGKHIITVTMTFNDKAVNLRFEDDGQEFNPLSTLDPDTGDSIEHPEIGGLGIQLINSAAEKIDYKRIDGKNCLTLTLTGLGDN